MFYEVLKSGNQAMACVGLFLHFIFIGVLVIRAHLIEVGRKHTGNLMAVQFLGQLHTSNNDDFIASC